MNKSIFSIACTTAVLLFGNTIINAAQAAPQEQHQNKGHADKGKANEHKSYGDQQQRQEYDNRGKGNDKDKHKFKDKDKGNGKQPMALERANPHSNAAYALSTHNKHVMQKHYHRILGKVDRHRRPKFNQGEVIPDRYRPYITPAPQTLVHRLTDLPRGCDVGYYQGYTVVYDPKTFVIVSLVDLLLNN
ncbi:hypothetical protein HR45_01170 [Shewanella mangrovi]|uniref:Uncharacterized protein n=1 Tax=Shewanella mangrovi TaxID=1515746 RepID=A0A094JIJ1_9GAMM|nr:hypothetical protein [Shewanella mangrovi]KFZ39037.1 hypothetical protein HR45_01170 [Shewanella mangrovi]